MADSREEKIIKSMLGEQVELEPPQSRIEVLLYELKDAIEQGGGGSGGNMVVTDTNGTLNKTWKEIHDALASGTFVVLVTSNETDLQQWCFYATEVDEDGYYLYPGNFSGGSANGYFKADTEYDYPVYVEDPLS